MKNDFCILIVEDDDLYRLNLEAFITELGYQLLPSVDNSEHAIEVIREKNPDIVIMDININGQLNGIEVAEQVSNTNTSILFITSSKQKEVFAKAKQTSSIGYLVKPFDQLTLQSAIEQSILRSEKRQDQQKENILIKHNSQLFKISISDILYIEAKGKLSLINTNEKKLISNTSISKFLTKLPSDKFIQIHKSYIINSDKISKIVSKNNELFIGKVTLPIGRVYKESFLTQFEIL